MLNGITCTVICGSATTSVRVALLVSCDRVSPCRPTPPVRRAGVVSAGTDRGPVGLAALTSGWPASVLAFGPLRSRRSRWSARSKARTYDLEVRRVTATLGYEESRDGARTCSRSSSSARPRNRMRILFRWISGISWRRYSRRSCIRKSISALGRRQFSTENA